MSLFRMPEVEIRTIEIIQSNFLWGSADLNKKLHMVNWDKIKQDKEIGGLGIRVLKEMNEALSLEW